MTTEWEFDITENVSSLDNSKVGNKNKLFWNNPNIQLFIKFRAFNSIGKKIKS